MSIEQAIALLRANGYRVTKPKPRSKKDRVGPTFVAKFADGEVTRMSTFTSLSNLDLGRGVRLSEAAYQTRVRQRTRTTDQPMKRVWVPKIVAAHFEQDGVRLAAYTPEQLKAA